MTSRPAKLRVPRNTCRSLGKPRPRKHVPEPRQGLGPQIRDDRGIAAIDMFAVVIVAMIPMFVIVMSVPSWVERMSFARVAAQEAARAVVLADSWEEGQAQAGDVVTQIAANYDVPGGSSLALSGALERGATVSATVSVQTPTLTIPFVTTVGSTTLSSTHTEVVDHYRSLPQ
jgi:Flp pilus assembly protein TadG